MDNLFLNKDHIVSVKRYDKKISPYNIWVEAFTIKLFGFVLYREEEHYKTKYKFSDSLTRKEWGDYVEYEPKGGLYNKPHLRFEFSNKSYEVVIFDTVIELENFLSENEDFFSTLMEIKDE